MFRQAQCFDKLNNRCLSEAEGASSMFRQAQCFDKLNNLCCLSGAEGAGSMFRQAQQASDLVETHGRASLRDQNDMNQLHHLFCTAAKNISIRKY